MAPETTPPIGILQEGLDTGIHPFEAWTFTRPSASVPTLGLKSDWKLSVAGAAVATYLMPPGTVLSYAGRTLPAGRWLSCAGQAVNRTTYAALFTAISTSWGVGNGTTTFNVPELRGVGLRGAGVNSLRSTAAGVSYNGLSVGSAIADQMQGHYHGGNDFLLNGGPNLVWASPGAGTDFGHTANGIGNPITDGTNGTPRTGTETRMATSSVQFIIAY